MANKREARIRKEARASVRALEAQLDAALVDAMDMRIIAIAAIAYVNEIYAPNIREPHSILNRRTDLVQLVRAHQQRQLRAIRSAA